MSHRLKYFLVLTWFCLNYSLLSALDSQEVPPNRPELSLPLFSKKMVIAHNMTWEIQRNAPGEEVDLYSPTGSTSNLGGIYQYLQYDSVLFMAKKSTLEEKVEQQINEAIFCGLDGFQFFFPLVREDAFMKKYSEIVKYHLKIADKKFPGFKITLCFSTPQGKDLNDTIDWYTKYVKDIIDETRDCQSWLKTPDGRTIFFTWRGDSILPELFGKNTDIEAKSELLAKVAWTFEEIGRRSGVKAAIIHHFRFPQNPTYVENFWKYFPGGWSWTKHLETTLPDLNLVAEIARQKNRMFSYTVFSDFYTSKVFKGNSWEQFYDSKQAVDFGIANLTRHVENVGLSDDFIDLLKASIEKDSSLMSVCTWNDFREGHHIAPEINHNFVPSILITYFKKVWQKDPEPIEKETVMVMYKKYAHDLTPLPFFIPIATKDQYPPAVNEDGVDILTLLKKDADIYYKGQKVGTAKAGLNVLKVKAQLGKVEVQVKREGQLVCSVTPPEWITDKPYRTDRLTYMFSSRCEEMFHTLYGKDLKLPISDEYAEETPGLPNWKKRLTSR